MKKSVRILGIETSCDETAVAVVESGAKIVSQMVASQVKLHAPFYGVVPELASRTHAENIPWLLSQTLRSGSIDAVAFTRGPGLAGALLVGKVAAETTAYALKVPLIGVHHLEGHIYAAEFETRLRFPLLTLVVSGGHTDLILVRGPGRYRVLGRTRDDAAGEAFDKVAKLLRLGYPGGPLIDRLARSGNAAAVEFPRPHLEGSWDFSFSGLKTSVLYHLQGHSRKGAMRYNSSGLSPYARLPQKRTADLCASFQEAVVDVLAEKALRAARAFGARQVVVGGGVAANTRLRERFGELRAAGDPEVIFPRPAHCTDNGAMIAQAAFHYLRAGYGTGRPGKNRLRAWEVDPALPIKSWAGAAA
ncbi:MAG: tRNA (adenosine(37)-N6)-threonylcarbamoyltransferase complex transferase subunit TsaD [Elusimicrobia bacterium]|nr:tRNA (adenosine(37)-N6)-threonylcarbamoyltransferase complex transferase subunit TsaD [Elusimicrobiota bacterium]